MKLPYCHISYIYEQILYSALCYGYIAAAQEVASIEKKRKWKSNRLEAKGTVLQLCLFSILLLTSCFV